MYSVLWSPDALQNLLRIWERAADQEAIDRAVARIDDRLANDPVGQSESRDPGRRMLIEAPLTVVFRMNEQLRVVIVMSVWHFQRRTPS
ncbi:MAG: type II toxin-antitoxin system RelE/ParE family toxin [Planctomycetia bacterium]|nr:type II toxin-antitoxin system RelE/ParE family toxin [Planctomycetia bacterium]